MIDIPLIRVGLVGANPDQSWAFRAHVPALASLPQALITAVATTREDTARRAAHLVGAAKWFTDARDLAGCEEVDLVVVAVKVPHHAEVVRAALDAGKHVYCEWPLALTSEDACKLSLRTRGEVRGFVGLQGRHDPAVAALREAVTQDQLGVIRSVSAHASRAKGVITAIPGSMIYTLDAATGAGTREVLGGHLLDLVDHVCGGISRLEGQARRSIIGYSDADDGSAIKANAADTLTAQITLMSGGIGAVAWWDGDPNPGTRILVQGTKGLAVLTSMTGLPLADQQPQITPMTLTMTDNAGTVINQITPLRSANMPMAARNLAAAYRAVLSDLQSGSTTAPSFADAAHIHQLLDNVLYP